MRCHFTLLNLVSFPRTSVSCVDRRIKTVPKSSCLSLVDSVFKSRSMVSGLTRPLNNRAHPPCFLSLSHVRSKPTWEHCLSLGGLDVELCRQIVLFSTSLSASSRPGWGPAYLDWLDSKPGVIVEDYRGVGCSPHWVGMSLGFAPILTILSLGHFLLVSVASQGPDLCKLSFTAPVADSPLIYRLVLPVE